MKVRSSVVALGAAAVLGGTCALAVPALASTQTTTHTLRFTSVSGPGVNFTKTTSGQQDKDVNTKGKVIGFDEIYFSFNLKTGTGTGNVALVVRGGVLYGTLKLTQSSISGRVTGGTGAFAHAKGTITAHNLNKAGTRTAVTIRYHS